MWKLTERGANGFLWALPRGRAALAVSLTVDLNVAETERLVPGGPFLHLMPEPGLLPALGRDVRTAKR